MKKKFEKLADAFLTLRGIQLYRTFLSKSQFYDDALISDYQIERLRDILIKAERTTPYYRKLFWEYNFDPKRFNQLDELQKLPILSKATVKSEIDQFYSYEAMKDSLELHTSGTTGEPMKVFTSKNQWVMEQGVVWRHWQWAGYRLGDRMAIIRSYSPAAGMPLHKLDRLRNWMYFSANHLSEQHCLEYLKILQNWKPVFLRGYPTSLYLLAKVARDNNIKLPSLKAALTASETLLDMHRVAIREAFDIEVFDHYGQAEITAMIHECEAHTGMHIDSEYGYVELIPTEEPTEYRIIATNLHNHAMPLIRYDTGDIAIMTEKRACCCGKTLPLIDGIKGRQDDYMYHAEGYPIPTVNFYTFFSLLESVYRFQMIQYSASHVEIRVLLKQDSNAQDCLNKIEAEMQHRFGFPCEVRLTNEFIESGEGKCLPLIQKIRKNI